MIHLYREVESTNDLALKAANGDGQHGDCWVADAQTKGRGRRELGGERRTWFSPSGHSIYMSILLRPRIETAKAAGLTLAAGIGVCEAIKHIEDIDIWLKWPNDIFIGKRKLGGILTEAVTGPTGELQAAVAGVGLNINVPEEMVPEDLRQIMTSVRMELGQPQDRMDFIFPIRESIVAWCDAYAHKGWEALKPGLERYDKSEGLAVEVNDHGNRADGIARGIDSEGRLQVELTDGTVKSLSTGEVQIKA